MIWRANCARIWNIVTNNKKCCNAIAAETALCSKFDNPILQYKVNVLSKSCDIVYVLYESV